MEQRHTVGQFDDDEFAYHRGNFGQSDCIGPDSHTQDEGLLGETSDDGEFADDPEPPNWLRH
jgi:hypothetical protein